MRRTLIGFALAVVLLVAGITIAQQNKAAIDLQAAIRTETANHDLKGAIKQYEAIVSKYPNDHAVAAAALLHMAECHQKLGDSEARKIYQRVVNDYSDQRETAAEAQAHLTALAGALPTATVIGGRRQLYSDGAWDAVSPDGRYLLGLGKEGDTYDLLSGEQSVMWSGDDAFFDNPVVSRDGKQVAWEGWSDELGVSEIRISQFTISTGAPRKVLFHNKDYMDTVPFGWSADGKEIFAILERQDRTSVIAAVSSEKGSLRILKSLEWRAPEKLSLSPDGNYIVYDTPVSGNSTNRDIFLLATNGSGEIPVVQGPSRDTSPVWTPDGNAIVFESDRSGTVGLWKMQLVKGKPQAAAEPLRPNSGDIRVIGFSRDGAFYYSARPTNSIADIFTAEIDLAGGSVLRPATRAIEGSAGHNSSPAFSPDGKSMAYFSQRSVSGGFVSIVVRTLASEKEIVIPTAFKAPSGPIWFPDGGSLLFSALSEGVEFTSLHRIDLNTGADVMSHKIDGDFASVAPDGKKIYFVRPDRGSDLVPAPEFKLMAYELETQRESELFKGKIPGGQGQRRLAVSPDGKQIAFTHSSDNPGPASLTAPNATVPNAALYVVSAQGGPARALRSPTAQRVRAIEWSADGKSVLAQKGNGELWWVPADGGESQRIGTGTYPVIESIHPDNKRIANTQNSVGQSKPDLWLDPDLGRRYDIQPVIGIYIAQMDPGSGKVIGPALRLTETAGDCAPSWSPDGNAIAFKRTGPNTIGQSPAEWVIRSLDTGNEKVYTVNYPACQSAPIWFHDGKSLLNGSFLAGQGQLFRLDLNTGQSTNLPLPHSGPALALSPDDKTLYLTVEDQKDKTTSIVSVDLATGEQKRVWVAPIAARPYAEPRRLALSPDGRTFALVLSELKGSSNVTHLIRVGVDGNGYRDLFSAEETTGAGGAALSNSALAWTRDGRSILFIDADSSGQRLMRVSAVGNAKPEFTGLAIPLTNYDGMFDLSPDGKRIAFFNSRTPNIAAKGK